MAESLKDKTVKGLGWSALDNAARYGMQFAVGIVLARLLSPDDYGLLGLVGIGWDLAYTAEGKWVVIEGNENGYAGRPQLYYGRGILKELQQLIGWKSEKEFWWEGKYTY